MYEGIYAGMSGWSWGGVALLRGLGAVLHPVCTALVALGWFRARERGWGELLRAYAAAVGLHTLWNGGFAAFVFVTGLDYYRGADLSLSLYGTGVQVLLVLFLALLALALWWLLYRLMNSVGQGIEPDLAPTIVSAPTVLRPCWKEPAWPKSAARPRAGSCRWPGNFSTFSWCTRWRVFSPRAGPAAPSAWCWPCRSSWCRRS